MSSQSTHNNNKKKRKQISSHSVGNNGGEEDEANNNDDIINNGVASVLLLGSLLTTEDVGRHGILPFLSFQDLVSLRASSKSLKAISDNALLERSTGLLPVNVFRFHEGFVLTVRARTGWSRNFTEHDAVLQSALGACHKFGNDDESDSIDYDEEMALNLLRSGKSVSMSKFQRRRQQVPEEEREDDWYLNWKVSAPTIHKQINASTAWRKFLNIHFFRLQRYDESIVFSRVLFGLLINTPRSIRFNSFKTNWESVHMEGKSMESAFLIELSDERKFEIEMSRQMSWEN